MSKNENPKRILKKSVENVFCDHNALKSQLNVKKLVMIKFTLFIKSI
jgi:hypothetical protein